VKKKQPTREDSPLIGVLKETIRDCGIQVADIARQTGVTHAQISRFLHGQRTLTLPAAEKLVKFFDLTLTKANGK